MKYTFLWHSHLAQAKRKTGSLKGTSTTHSLLLVGLGGGFGLLSQDSALSAGAREGAGGGEGDLLLGVGAHHEGRDVDHLLADADVALVDQHTGVVDGLGEVVLEDDGLESSVEHVSLLEGQHVIELVLGALQNAGVVESVQQAGALEDALGVVLLEHEQLLGSLADLGQSVVHSPDLALAAETELT